MANEKIKRGMEMTFGPILMSYREATNNPKATLIRCFACMIHHAEKLQEVIDNNPGHNFSKLLFLSDASLLNELKGLVTTEVTEGVMKTPTGIPPHVEIVVVMRELLEKSFEIFTAVSSQTSVIVKAVTDTIEAKSWDAGNISGDRLKLILEDFQENLLKKLMNI